MSKWMSWKCDATGVIGLSRNSRCIPWLRNASLVSAWLNSFEDGGGRSGVGSTGSWPAHASTERPAMAMPVAAAPILNIERRPIRWRVNHRRAGEFMGSDSKVAIRLTSHSSPGEIHANPAPWRALAPQIGRYSRRPVRNGTPTAKVLQGARRQPARICDCTEPPLGPPAALALQPDTNHLAPRGGL